MYAWLTDLFDTLAVDIHAILLTPAPELLLVIQYRSVQSTHRLYIAETFMMPS